MEVDEAHDSEGREARGEKRLDISKPFGELPREAQEAMLYGSDEVLPLIFTDRSGDWEYNGKYMGAHPMDRKTLQRDGIRELQRRA